MSVRVLLGPRTAASEELPNFEDKTTASEKFHDFEKNLEVFRRDLGVFRKERSAIAMPEIMEHKNQIDRGA